MTRVGWLAIGIVLFGCEGDPVGEVADAEVLVGDGTAADAGPAGSTAAAVPVARSAPTRIRRVRRRDREGAGMVMEGGLQVGSADTMSTPLYTSGHRR